VRDEEIARGAGVSVYSVAATRRKLGIAPPRSRTLDAIKPAEVLRLVRTRSRSGKRMYGLPSDDSRLLNLCQYHFGCWYAAVSAAGLKPEGVPHRKGQRPPEPQPLTEALLRSGKSSAALELLTGVPRSRVAYKRAKLGIVRDERTNAARIGLRRPAASA